MATLRRKDKEPGGLPRRERIKVCPSCGGVGRKFGKACRLCKTSGLIKFNLYDFRLSPVPLPPAAARDWIEIDYTGGTREQSLRSAGVEYQDPSERKRNND